MDPQHLQFSCGSHQYSGVLKCPNEESQEVVLLLHPHPLYGGDMDSPVITSLESIFYESDLATFRFNFRGTSENPGTFEGLSGALEDVVNCSHYLEKHNYTIYGVVGYSFGGSTALRFAISHPVAFVVTLSASFTLFKEGNYDISKLSSVRCPVLMFHGTSDRMVPFTDMNTLATRIGSRVNSINLAGEDHFYYHSMPRVLAETRNFVKSLC